MPNVVSVRKLAAARRGLMRSFHLTFAAVGRHPLFPTEAGRRTAVRALGRVAGDAIVLFALVDDHVHVVVFCEEVRVGRLARAILLALRPLAAAGLEPAFTRPVRDRGHLEWLVGYVLTQPEHHGLREHPALTTGSCYRDLVGARVVQGLTLPIVQALPRFRLSDAARHVGLAYVDLCPVSDAVVRAAGAARLVGAATAALAVGPEPQGNEPDLVAARRAVVHVGLAAGIHLAELAHALGVGLDAARKIGAHPVHDAVSHAVRLSLALEAAAAAGAAGGTPRPRAGSARP